MFYGVFSGFQWRDNKGCRIDNGGQPKIFKSKKTKKSKSCAH